MSLQKTWTVMLVHASPCHALWYERNEMSWRTCNSFAQCLTMFQALRLLGHVLAAPAYNLNLWFD